MNKTSFADAVLHGLGIPSTAGARKAFVGWIDAEGGHWHNNARFNPLNTTQPEPGAGNTGSQGNIKVYKDWQQGVDATIATLSNGRYGNILKAFKQGNPSAVANAIGSSPWGTSASLVQQTIAGTHAGSTPRSSPSVPEGSSSASDSQPPTRTLTRTIPGQSFAAERGAAIQSFLGSGRNDSQNNLDFALQIRGLQDVPSRTVQTSGSGGSVGLPSGSSGTTQTLPSSSSTAAGSPGSQVDQLTRRANALNAQHLPYSWGGGHGSKAVNPYDAVPVDCSGAVSSVLGIDPRVSGQFGKWGKPGVSQSGVTVYSNGHHVLMSIGGHFFGTSRSNPGGGAGWIPRNQISPAYLQGFTARHL